MFNIRIVLMKAFRGAIGNMPDYKIRLNSIGYYDKGILTKDDITELDAMIDERNKVEDFSNDSSENESSIEDCTQTTKDE